MLKCILRPYELNILSQRMKSFLEINEIQNLCLLNSIQFSNEPELRFNTLSSFIRYFKLLTSKSKITRSINSKWHGLCSMKPSTNELVSQKNSEVSCLMYFQPNVLMNSKVQRLMKSNVKWTRMSNVERNLKSCPINSDFRCLTWQFNV